MFAPNQLTSILRSLPDPAFVLTRSGRYVSVFGGTDERASHAGTNLPGQTLHSVFSPEKANWFLEQIKTALALRTLHIVEYELAETDLKSLPASISIDTPWFEARIRALDFLVQGEEVVLWSVSSISARRQLQDKLESSRETDQLTGLWSRQHFYKVAAMELERARRAQHPVALLIFDIDHFKNVNDRHGNAVGDMVLADMARVVVSCIRRSDVAIRWADEEFAVLMPYSATEAASQVAERIRFAAQNHTFPQNLRLTISCGYGQWALESESIDALLMRIDQAVGQAQRQGRNRCVEISEIPNIAQSKS